MDNNLVFRDGSSNLTATENLTATLIGPMANPLWVIVEVPSVSGTSPTLDISIEHQNSGGTMQHKNTYKQVTAAGHYSIPVFSRQDKIQVKLTVGGTSPNFGGVKVYLANADRYTS